jgi:replication initiation protein RepC
MGQFDYERSNMTAGNGQNVRHHHKSNIEQIEKNLETTQTNHTESPRLTVSELLARCPEAAQFAVNQVTTMQDVVQHAQMLAPMIGIDRKCYEAAQIHLGSEQTAKTVWALMQFHERIERVGAYFRAITIGRRSKGFDPERLIRSFCSSPLHAA